MKFYINDFVEDLNYHNIILYIGNVDTDKLLEQLENDYVNHLNRFGAVLENDLMLIENCDLQEVDTLDLTEYGNSLLYLLKEGYVIYSLKFDEETGKYFVDTNL